MSSAAEHSLLRRLHQRYGGSLVTVGTRLIDIPCRYGMHLMIALRLSLDQVGAFYIVFGALMIASGLGRLGIDRALTREMARLLAADDAAGARAAMRRAAIMVLLLSLALTALALLAAWPLAAYVMRKPDMAPLFVIGALAILPQNFANLVAGALAGLHRVTQSQIVYTWLWPGLFCVLVFALPMSDAHALAAVAASMTLATLIGGVMLLRDLPAGPPLQAPVCKGQLNDLGHLRHGAVDRRHPGQRRHRELLAARVQTTQQRLGHHRIANPLRCNDQAAARSGACASPLSGARGNARRPLAGRRCRSKGSGPSQSRPHSDRPADGCSTRPWPGWGKTPRPGC